MSGPQQGTLVATWGNVMAADDGFGPRVAEWLQERRSYDLNVVDLGMQPGGLLSHLSGCDRLIIVDALQPQTPWPPGELVTILYQAGDRTPWMHDTALSSHGLTIGNELELARQLNLLPAQVWFLACVACHATIGEDMCRSVKQIVPRAGRRALELVARGTLREEMARRA